VHEFHIAMRGYDRRQVDELLARIEGTTGRAPAAAVPVTAADIRAARFTKKMRGYARRKWTRRCGTRWQSWSSRLPDAHPAPTRPGPSRSSGSGLSAAMACQPTSAAVDHAKYPPICQRLLATSWLPLRHRSWLLAHGRGSANPQAVHNWTIVAITEGHLVDRQVDPMPYIAGCS
jgi:DivIVA domain-containing protein